MRRSTAFLALFALVPVIVEASEPMPQPTITLKASEKQTTLVLQELFGNANVRYQIDEKVSGTVSVDLKDVLLDKAIESVLASATSSLEHLVVFGVHVVRPRTPQDDENVPEYFRARKISDADLAKKKEGRFTTFLPDVSSDPVYGQGIGLRTNIFWNGKRSDPTFAYTPYQAKLSLNAFVTDRDAQEFAVSLDMPYFRASRFRLKADLKVGENPNKIYFGITEKTLGKLGLPGGQQFDKYDDFDKARNQIRPGGPGEPAFVADTLSNRFNEKEIMLNLKADYAIGDGRLKVMGGYEIQRLDYNTFTGRTVVGTDPATGQQISVPNGTSVLDQDAQNGIAKGTRGGIVSILQQALIYDTRDFEPDPTSGVYFELANELSIPAIGSDFVFDKLFAQARFYKKLPFGERTIFAGRLATGNIFGNDAPFFEYQDQWSPDRSINAVGGADSLRGYVANRFLARAVFFANAEVRYRVGEAMLFGQRFGLNIVPFLDLATVRDNWLDVNFDRIKTSYGTGIRLAWNQSTIIAADFGFSSEGRQFFLGLGQQF